MLDGISLLLIDHKEIPALLALMLVAAHMDPILFVLLSFQSRMTSVVCVGSVLVPAGSIDCSHSSIKAGLD